MFVEHKNGASHPDLLNPIKRYKVIVKIILLISSSTSRTDPKLTKERK
jgi:hypothetical protein